MLNLIAEIVKSSFGLLISIFQSVDLAVVIVDFCRGMIFFLSGFHSVYTMFVCDSLVSFCQLFGSLCWLC